MQKVILLTGATDGIGLEAAKMLIADGHHILIHGRNQTKLENALKELSALPGNGHAESFLCDLSLTKNVLDLANAVKEKHARMDVLINNAGVYKSGDPMTPEGLDIRFAVNTVAPYLLTRELRSLFDQSGRIINVSSAAQAPVDLTALSGEIKLSDGAAYAQSKLALTMWSQSLGNKLKDSGPLVVSVNPGSMLGSKMVKEAFGVAGGDIRIGADILFRAALSDEFADAAALYFDNDSGRFAPPHSDAQDSGKVEKVVNAIERLLAEKLGFK